MPSFQFTPQPVQQITFTSTSTPITLLGPVQGIQGDPGSDAPSDHTLLSNIGTNTHAQIDTHIANTSNPHSVTKTQVGLSNVDNTSDVNKPVSTATQTALNGKFTQRTITGTTNQITVTNGDGVSGNPTLSLPQDIHTGASPTFAGASLTGGTSITPLTVTTTPATDNVTIKYGNHKNAANAKIYIQDEFKNTSSTSFIGLEIRTTLENATPSSEQTFTDIYGYTAGAQRRYLQFYSNSIYQYATNWILTTGTTITPAVNTINLGGSSNYFGNMYTNRLYLNSTAYLDGGTAGRIAFTGHLASASNYGSDLGTTGGAFATVRAGVFRADYSVGLALSDASNIQFGTVTGTKIGTATTQKLGFYNATPVVRPSGDIGTALSNLGLVASPVITTATDVEITDTTKGVILKSPNGTRWRITIDNTGALTSTSI